MSLVVSEVVGWWPSEMFRVVRNPDPAAVRTARLADLRIPYLGGNRSKATGGRSGHAPRPTSLARRRAHARAET